MRRLALPFLLALCAAPAFSADYQVSLGPMPLDDETKAVIAGSFKPAMVRQGLGEGMMAVAPFGTAVPADVRSLVTAAADRIGKGFNPFTGPVTDNSGVVRISTGESCGGDKMGNFDWYVEGVIGKAK